MAGGSTRKSAAFSADDTRVLTSIQRDPRHASQNRLSPKTPLESNTLTAESLKTKLVDA